MFRITIVLFVVFIVGIIANDNSETQPKSSSEAQPNSEINGDLSIVPTDYTDTEKPIEYVKLNLEKIVDGVLHYGLGARASVDKLVASGSHNQSWTTPHDAAVQLTYPSRGQGVPVTYIGITVNQTSTSGKAYVVKSDLVSIIVEAHNTLVFNVNAEVYGA